MLTPLEVGEFHAFGYVVLRGCLSPKEFAAVEAAYVRVIADAPVYNYFGQNETRMLFGFVRHDETLGALIEHPGVMEAARDIWGAECLYIAGSDLWSNRDDTPWHSDGNPGRQVKTLKTAIYLDEQSEGQGALNVIPGSHHPEFCAAIFRSCGYWDQGRPRLRLPPDRVTGAVSLRTRPGDVVLWDNRLWHSAFRRQDGKPRRTMFISYAPDPGDDLLALADLRATMRAHLGEKQPYVYDRAMVGAGGDARRRMAERLEALGVERVREPGNLDDPWIRRQGGN